MARFAAPHPLVVPWRGRIPLVSEVDPECALAASRLVGESLGVLQLLGEFAADRIGNVNLTPLESGESRCLRITRNTRRFTLGALRQYLSKASKVSPKPGLNERTCRARRRPEPSCSPRHKLSRGTFWAQKLRKSGQ